MGMGKTIQIIALMLAIHRKHGNQRDLHEIRHRRSLPTALGYPPPCLVVVPSSVISNWARELDTWGHFLHRCCDGKVAVLAALEEVRSGHLEVMVIGYSQLVLNESDLADVTWSVVIFDEGHELKNCKTDRYQAALNVGKHKRCRMRVTLTGTPIQNKMEELWAILNLITQERFQTFETFNEHFRDPIKMAMSTKYEGVEGIVKRGISSQRELNLMMEDYILKRKKDSLSGEHKLKGKTEWVVLSELTELQRALYAHVISLPDFDNARYAKAMCPIHHHTIRKECCDTYMRPILRASASSTEPTLDPRAVLWHQMHRDGAACRNCPTCISLPIQHKLRSIYNDPALLKCRASDQVSIARTSERPTEDKLAEDKSEYGLDGVEAQEVWTKRSDFLKNCLPEELLESLGGEYREKDTLLYQNGERRSGKMHDLLCLLRRFREEGHKSLVFSESTMMLDLIEIQIRFGGWISLRLDGSTPNKMRKSIVDSFNNDKEIEVLLLSSRAGGVGLNLTGATRVVQFDCNWNPTVDQQAQDRAYRIGQTCPVEVFHLVAKGTLEELIYLRQMYKQSVQRTIEGNTLEQKFEGIQGDPQTYGELFGLENMMQYSKNSLIEELQTQYNEKQGLTTAQTAATEGDADAQIALIASMARRHTEKMRTEKMAVQRVSADVLHGLLQAAPQEGEGSSEVQQILQQVIATSVPNAAPYNPAVLPLTQTEHTPMSARPVNMYDATNGTPRDTTDAEPQTPAPIAAINTPPSRRKLPVNINGNIKTTLNKLS